MSYDTPEMIPPSKRKVRIIQNYRVSYDTPEIIPQSKRKEHIIQNYRVSYDTPEIISGPSKPPLLFVF